MGVGVPQEFYCAGPAGNFLNFVQNQQSPGGGFPGLEAGQILLLLQPSPLTQSWLVGGGVVGGHPARVHHLPGERGLANLARAGQDLEESARLFHPPQQGIMNGFANHHILLSTLSKPAQRFTQAE